MRTHTSLDQSVKGTSKNCLSTALKVKGNLGTRMRANTYTKDKLYVEEGN
jgi:hypothetical protein